MASLAVRDGIVTVAFVGLVVVSKESLLLPISPLLPLLLPLMTLCFWGFVILLLLLLLLLWFESELIRLLLLLPQLNDFCCCPRVSPCKEKEKDGVLLAPQLVAMLEVIAAAVVVGEVVVMEVV